MYRVICHGSQNVLWVYLSQLEAVSKQPQTTLTHTVDDASQLFSLKTSLHTSLLACNRDKVRQSKQIMNFPISVELRTVGHSVTARWTLIAAS